MSLRHKYIQPYRHDPRTWAPRNSFLNHASYQDYASRKKTLCERYARPMRSAFLKQPKPSQRGPEATPKQVILNECLTPLKEIINCPAGSSPAESSISDSYFRTTSGPKRPFGLPGAVWGNSTMRELCEPQQVLSGFRFRILGGWHQPRNPGCCKHCPERLLLSPRVWF